MWTGVIRTADRDAYREYLEQTGLAEYRATPGNIDAMACTGISATAAPR